MNASEVPNSTWALRVGTRSDKPAILALINTIQPHIPWSPEHYDWQFLQGPAGPAEIRIIEADDRVVSLYVGTRKHIWVEGELRRGIMVQDVLTHPNYRGRGFLNCMASSFLSEVREWGDCGYTFPNKLSENSFRRTGWTVLTAIPALRATLNANADGLTPFEPDLLTEVGQFEPTIDAVWRNCGIKIGVLRNADYLNWRYSRPHTDYRRFLIARDQGYVVLKLYTTGDSRVMHICDLVLREDARDLCGTVLATIKNWSVGLEVTSLTAWLPNEHPYQQNFEAAGLQLDRSNDRFAFTTGPRDVIDRLASSSLWHLSQGDSDVY